MNCRSAEDLFSSFLEDEVSQKERRTLEAHLAECRRCSAAVEELRATVDLMSALPSYETAPHFEEDVMDRIRSGEALRPSVIEWVSEWLQPVRLRPVFLAGATACAAWIAFLMVNPTPSSVVATRTSPPAATTGEARGPETGAAEVASQPPAVAPLLPAGSETIASGPRPSRTSSGAGSEAVASAPSSYDAAADSARGGAAYQDEYILDQFYLNRSSENGIHSIVPVTGRASDDVYITF